MLLRQPSGATVCHKDSEPVCDWPAEWTIRVCDAHGEVVREGPRGMGVCTICAKGCYSGAMVPSQKISVVQK